MGRILVVDDERSMRELLGIVLRRAGHEPELAASGQEALDRYAEGPFDLVIHDLKMPGMSGIELLQALKEQTPDLPVIVITAFATWDNTVEAMRLGAYDYIKKPFDTDLIRHVVERVLTRSRLRQKSDAEGGRPGLDLVTAAPVMRQVIDVIRRVAPTDATILIEGESGTGKELVARMCHYLSARAEEPFIAVNCGAFTESLLESELFGHVRGAFTGAVADKSGLLTVAHGGTFFMDEIGEMPQATQVKLLRVLEERQFFPVGGTKPARVDVRFVGATNRNLQEEVEAGRFRGDLFYRLNVIPITLPPLRERKEDIPLLAGHFVRKYAERIGREVTGIAPSGQARLSGYHWPGNVRELENVIQRAIALSQAPLIEDLGIRFSGVEVVGRDAASGASGAWALAEPSDPGAEPPLPAFVPPPLPEAPAGGFCLETSLANVERAMLVRALEATDGNMTKAAEVCGITFRSMRYKVKKLGIAQ